MTDDEFDAWLMEVLDCRPTEKPFADEQVGIDYVANLRADLARVTEERDRLAERNAALCAALCDEPFDSSNHHFGWAPEDILADRDARIRAEARAAALEEAAAVAQVAADKDCIAHTYGRNQVDDAYHNGLASGAAMGADAVRALANGKDG